MRNLIGYGVQLLLVTGVMLLLYGLIRTSLRALLDQLLRFPAGTQFYLRALLLLLFFAAWQKAVGDKWEYAAGTAFMEYVWDVAGTLGSVLEQAFWFFLIYLSLITILTAVLRRKHEP